MYYHNTIYWPPRYNCNINESGVQHHKPTLKIGIWWNKEPTTWKIGEFDFAFRCSSVSYLLALCWFSVITPQFYFYTCEGAAQVVCLYIKLWWEKYVWMMNILQSFPHTLLNPSTLVTLPIYKILILVQLRI